MELQAAIYFRDQLREARAIALKDVEAFEEIVFVLERLGSYLHGRTESLHVYKDNIVELACQSPLAQEIPSVHPDVHAPFAILYELVKDARNFALHVGAFARHLTVHAVALSIILEDALENGLTKFAIIWSLIQCVHLFGNP